MELTVTVLSDFEAVEKAVLRLTNFLVHDCQIKEQSLIFSLKFCMRELLNNAVEHGNYFDVSKIVECQLICTGDTTVLKVSDQGAGFDLDQVLELEDNSRLDRFRCRGLSTLVSMGFEISTYKNQVEAVLNI